METMKPASEGTMGAPCAVATMEGVIKTGQGDGGKSAKLYWVPAETIHCLTHRQPALAQFHSKLNRSSWHGT